MSIVYERKNITGRVGSTDSPGYLMFAEKDQTSGEEGDIVKFSNDNSVTITGVKPGVNPNDVAVISQLANNNNSSVMSKTIYLLSNGWLDNTQVVSIDGILEDNTKQIIFPYPMPEYEDIYKKYGISATKQSNNSLTFKCNSIPPSGIEILVFVIG